MFLFRIKTEYKYIIISYINTNFLRNIAGFKPITAAKSVTSNSASPLGATVESLFVNAGPLSVSINDTCSKPTGIPSPV